MGRIFAVLMFLLCLQIGNASDGNATGVTAREKELWLRNLIPLPHEIEFVSKAVVKPSEVTIKFSPDAGEIERQAVSELQALFVNKTGVDPLKAVAGLFEIIAGVMEKNGTVLGIEAEDYGRLQTLPNKSQAYLIQSFGDNRILITALDARGLYYGIQTLKQLLEPAMNRERVEIPLVTVADWPDIEERGIWNSRFELSELSSLKLNFSRFDVNLNTVERGVPITVRLSDNAKLPERRSRAFVIIPTLFHLNFLNYPQYGNLYKAYPEVAGKGEKAFQKENPSPYHQVPCATHPLYTKLLTEILIDTAAKGLPEIDVWQSEFISQCECPACEEKGQFCAETEAIINAWRQVQKEYPDFKLRIFFSLVDNQKKTYDCLMNLPVDVKAGWVYGPRKPFDELAAKGYWVASWAIQAGAPYDFLGVKQGVKDLHDKRWSGAYGYSANKYGMAALAETSWNINGRDEKEFAVAWALKKGYANPEGVAEWIMLIGPVKQWQYLSRFDVRAMPQRIGTGKTVAGFPEKVLAQYIEDAESALEIAEELGIEEFIYESKISAAYFKLLEGLNKVLSILGKDLSVEENRTSLNKSMEELKKLVKASVDVSGGKNEGGMDWLEAVSKKVQDLIDKSE